MSLPEVRALSYTEELAPLWDVWIHILGIGAECACWGAGGPGVPVLQGRGWESAPSSGPPGHLPPEGKAFGGLPPHPPQGEGGKEDGGEINITK